MDQIHKKMSIRFARSLSFPVPSAAASQFLAVKIRSAASAVAGNPPSDRLRSASLPPRLHPIVAQIEDEIRSLRSWQNSPISSSGAGSPAWIAAGLAGIDDLHSSLADLLHHPQSHDALFLRRSVWADRLLDDSLRFADAHSGFRAAIIALTDHLSAARSALRRRDDASLAAALRAQKKTEKQLLKLAASVRSIGRLGLAEAADLGGVIREATAITASASAAVFAGMAMLASAAIAGVSPGSSPACVVGALVWRSAAFKRRMEVEGEGWRERAMRRMEEVEKCISQLEICSRKVLRRMMNARVFLLNTQTPVL